MPNLLMWCLNLYFYDWFKFCTCILVRLGMSNGMDKSVSRGWATYTIRLLLNCHLCSIRVTVKITRWWGGGEAAFSFKPHLLRGESGLKKTRLDNQQRQHHRPPSLEKKVKITHCWFSNFLFPSLWWEDPDDHEQWA